MLTLPFDDPASLDARLVGGKAHGLAFMTAAGVPVAPGFTLTTRAYHDFMRAQSLGKRIKSLIDGLDVGSVSALDAAEHQIAEWFEAQGLPETVTSALEKAYAALSRTVRVENVSVAVRSSATAEDAEGSSFAGEYETYVGISGLSDLVRYVRKCWASAFTARGMAYVLKNGLSPTDIEMAVVIQKTVNARAAGVMFTLSPLTGDRSRIVIEAAYGLGLSVVGGEVTPDRYTVKKIGLDIVERVLGEKHMEYLTGDRATPVDAERRGQFCLADDELVALASLGKQLERQHQRPVDIEFALDADLPAGRHVILLQCRPETYWAGRHAASAAAPVGNPAQAVLASVRKIGRSGLPGADQPIIEEK